MVKLVKFVIILCLVNISKSHEMYSDYSKTHVAHFYQFWDDCPGYSENNSQTVRNVRMYGNKTNMALEGYSILKIDYPPTFQIMIELQKCRSREAPDTCLTLTSIRSDRACLLMNAKDQFYSPLLHCMDPPFTCPPKKGRYKLKDCRLDMTKFKWFPIPQNFYFKVRYFCINKRTKENFVCQWFEGQLEPKRGID